MNFEREAVLFIHSTGTGPSLWRSVDESVVGRRHVLTPANLGYPPNAVIERGRKVTIADEAEHLVGTIPPGIERVHVVAHSYGATVALHMLRMLDQRLASAFLYEPVLFGSLATAGSNAVPFDAVLEARSFLEHPWFLADESRGGAVEWLEMFVDYWNRPGAWSKMPASARDQTIAVGWKMFQEVRSCFADETPFDAWRLPVASTVVHGERSPLASRAMARALAHGRPHRTLVEIPGVGHMAPLTHPSLVHAELGRHMARLCGSEAFTEETFAGESFREGAGAGEIEAGRAVIAEIHPDADASIR
jgi:pimeloyl-ACP methyl ester carboxylesterase